MRLRTLLLAAALLFFTVPAHGDSCQTAREAFVHSATVVHTAESAYARCIAAHNANACALEAFALMSAEKAHESADESFIHACTVQEANTRAPSRAPFSV